VAKALQSFYRFFERYERITGESFYRLTSRKLDEVTVRGSLDKKFVALREKFIEHMNDDFNTGGAVGVLFELLTGLNQFIDSRQLEKDNPDAYNLSIEPFKQAALVLRELSSILGLFYAPVEKSGGGEELAGRLGALAGELGVPSPRQTVDELMPQFIQARAEARKAKNFGLADQIRKRLGELKVTLEDRPGGKTDWRVEG
jgi:cysteinyl-tRNA synthetase